MPPESQVCLNCSQGITNPICERCHTRQLALWLNDAGVDMEIINYMLGNIKGKFQENLNDMNCILCRRETVSLCTYCYFFKIEAILRNLNLPKGMISYFLEIFNYKLYDSAYSSYS